MKLLPLIITLVILLAPDLALAQGNITPDGLYTGGGLIPCGQTAANACNSCHVVILANTIIKWLIGITFMIFAGMAVYAGVKLVMSGGNSHAKEDAKQMFTNAFIGLFIILAAWLMVDTLLRFVLKNGETGKIDGYGPWSEVECVTENESMTTKMTIEEEEFKANSALIAANGGVLPEVQGAGGACASAFVGKYFPSEIGNAQCIIKKESNCGAVLWRTDVMSDRRPFSVGPMQINLTVHKLYSCGSATLDCPAAFNGKNRSATVKNEALYKQCVAAASNFDCNLKNGKIIRDNRGSWADWSTARACGLVK